MTTAKPMQTDSQLPVFSPDQIETINKLLLCAQQDIAIGVQKTRLGIALEMGYRAGVAFAKGVAAFQAMPEHKLASDPVYHLLEKTYLAKVGHLPGSERTARLRKKRHDAVLRYWRVRH